MMEGGAMSVLEIELKAIIQAMEQALSTGDLSALKALIERKTRLCAVLAALDPAA